MKELARHPGNYIYKYIYTYIYNIFIWYLGNQKKLREAGACEIIIQVIRQHKESIGIYIIYKYIYIYYNILL